MYRIRIANKLNTAIQTSVLLLFICHDSNFPLKPTKNITEKVLLSSVPSHNGRLQAVEPKFFYCVILCYTSLGPVIITHFVWLQIFTYSSTRFHNVRYANQYQYCRDTVFTENLFPFPEQFGPLRWCQPCYLQNRESLECTVWKLN